MCDICRQSPCDPRCPNAEPAKKVDIGFCSNCNCLITSDYTYWVDTIENIYCSRDCAEEYYGLKEVEYNAEH